jgi:hypothetical protein
MTEYAMPHAAYIARASNACTNFECAVNSSTGRIRSYRLYPRHNSFLVLAGAHLDSILA